MNRRQALGLLAGGAALAAGGGALAKTSSQRRMPSIFLAHGSPMLLDDATWVLQLRQWAERIGRPRSVLVLSAHWEERPLTLGATRTAPLLYDFYGFPARYYQQQYPAPGAPDLAARVRALAGEPVGEQPGRGLDHGAYVPLVAMYPRADVPVLQVSLPSLHPQHLFEIGRRLAPLRDEGVLIIGSGFLAHNLRLMSFGDSGPPPAWASDFDAWNEQVLRQKDFDALVQYRDRAPAVSLALPTHEHFVPVLAAAGAAEPGDAVSFPITGYMGRTLTKRSVQFG